MTSIPTIVSEGAKFKTKKIIINQLLIYTNKYQTTFFLSTKVLRTLLGSITVAQKYGVHNLLCNKK